MKEYIEKGTACEKMPDDIYGFRDKKILKSIPAADVVPVVRCKNCKFGTSDHSGFVVCRMASYPNYTARNQNWYCASGERKGGDENEKSV